ncbi:hypothetical protein CYQ84_10380, partial [Enterococcus faecium]|uniref:oligosaccharide flippase family protein n=1 Tax=Enterococcus faecium TaxID=1352 RepID=UPI00100E1970
MNKTVKNLIFNAIYQFFLIAIPVITIPYVSRVLGPELLGSYSYVTSIITFLSSFVMMGLNQLGVREISKINEEGSKNDLLNTFTSLWKMQLLVGIVTIPIYFVLLKVMNETHIIALLFLPMLISYILDISWFFWGIEQITSVVLRNLFIKIVILILTIVFVKNIEDYYLYVVINCVGQLLSNIIFWGNLRKFFSPLRLSSSRLRTNKMFFIKAALVLLIPQIAIQVYSSLDKTIVGGLLSNTELSFYDQSQKIPRIINSIVSSMSLILMPKMVKLDRSERNSLMKTSIDLTLFLSLLFCGEIIVVSHEFIPIFFGEKFQSMEINLIISSLLIPFISFGGVFSNQFTLSQGQYVNYTIPFVIGAVVNPILLYIFVPLYGAVGASIILVFTEGIICFLRIYVTRKYLSFSEIFKMDWTFCSAFIISVFIVYQVPYLGNNLLSVFGKAIFYLIFYLLICILLNKRLRTNFIKLKRIYKNNK